MTVNVVISQPMLFPWLGMLDQIKNADIFVMYDDVSFSSGSFVNRVQMKPVSGLDWMTAPVLKMPLGARINEIPLASGNWRRKHEYMLAQGYTNAPFVADMLHVFREVYSANYEFISELAGASLIALLDYFKLRSEVEILYSSKLPVKGSSSERVLDIVKYLGGSCYITGHGAKRYLDHSLFEDANIKVYYMDYDVQPYPQNGTDFTPYVSALDAIAWLGRGGLSVSCSKLVYWEDFLGE